MIPEGAVHVPVELNVDAKLIVVVVYVNVIPPEVSVLTNPYDLAEPEPNEERIGIFYLRPFKIVS